MQRIIFIGTALAAMLLGWMVFLSPATTEYRDARASRDQARQEHDNVVESGYRVNDADTKAMERAVGDDFALSLRNLEYAVTQQDDTSVIAIGPEYNLEAALAALSGATTTVDPTYNVLIMPADVAPIRPIDSIGFRYSLGNNDVRLAVNKKA